MNRLTKILLATVGIVVLGFLAVAITVAFVFEPNDYRPLVVDTVRDATGRDFTLDGDLELKLFPCCGVKVGSAMLGNPSGFPAEPFVRIESAAVSVKLWPLLTRREVQIGTVTLRGADVRLVELPDGRANWQFETDGTTPSAADGSTGAATLSIDGLVIRDARLAYQGADGARYSATDIQLDAGAIGGPAPVPIRLRLTAADEGTATSGTLDLNGELALDGDLVVLNAPTLTVSAAGAGLPTGELDLELTAAAARYQSGEGTAEIEGLDATLAVPGARLALTGDAALAGETVTGAGTFQISETSPRKLLAALPDVDYRPVGPNALEQLSGSGRWALTGSGARLDGIDLMLDGSAISGDVAIASFDGGAVSVNLAIDRLDADAYQASESAPTAPGAGGAPMEVPFETLADLPVEATLKVDALTAQGIALRGLSVRLENDGRRLSAAIDAGLAGGRLKLEGAGSPAGDSPAIAGRLELTNVSPRALLTALGEPVETAKPDALSQLSGSSRWKLGRRSIELEQMSWQLDATRLTGTLAIDDFASAATRFDVALDRMDLDDYLAPTAESEADTPPAAEDMEIPAPLIRDLNLKGHLKAGAIRVVDLDLANVDATVTAANGVLKLEPLTAELYGGSYRGTIAIDATGERSRVTLDQQLSAVQVGQLLDALVGSDRIAGALTLNMSGSGEGTTQNELLKALTGNVAFSLSDGVYHGMDIAYEIENAQSLLKRSAAPERPNKKETPIRALSFSGTMADGVLGSDALNAEIPFLKLGGRGGVNLLERTLDYQLNAQVLRSADNAADSGLKGLGGSVIPLQISGSMADPRVGVNLRGLVVETVKERARDELFKQLGLNRQPATADGAGGVSDSGAPGPASADATGAQAPTVNEAAAAGATTPTDAAAPAAAGATADATSEPDPAAKTPAEPPTTRDLIEQGLRGFLRKREADKDKSQES